ncbi:MAG: Vi polysaccharide biosynthesis UDP-N-acetylglucosamine C-6 dehydrogenase TviB [Erythrobacter sp.]|nr:Vi polysaccharide biosynthesis protein VipA/TviB [Erythrobacter sp. AP23]MBO6768991.1 Vi polysaccharide biosynthesis UDP-N-acetylglucosamine C-6 dehydrogenase TviB [Erythrobacter sp.]
MIADQDKRIGVIGLGYVGLPLAVEFAKHFSVVGFDINQTRVEQLRAGHDDTLETSDEELAQATRLHITCDDADLAACNFYIVTVPTPVNEFMQPDLSALVSASELIGSMISQGDFVVYESTVYPGATEDECVPVIERVSGLRLNQDFFAGYSPERINPGDTERRLPQIKKITAGSTTEAAATIDAVYKKIIKAGTFCAENIRVAEAAKVIENTQRDLNIALVNELAIIFNRMGIDTQAVLEAAGTKWNFLPFRPGLVGGHCIGVDPYYLTHKAQSVGYHPQVILSGRQLNEGMGIFVAEQLIKAMTQKAIDLPGSRVLILGLAFKENCPDLRNTRVIDVVQTLRSYSIDVDIHDPWVNPSEAKDKLDIELIANPQVGSYDAVLIAVPHNQFLERGGERLRAFGKPIHVLYDLKSVLPFGESDLRL